VTVEHRLSVRPTIKDAIGLVYEIYALVLTLITGALLWPLVAIAPVSHRFRLKAVRVGGTALRHLVGVRLSVAGTIADNGPVVIVANHASFADGLILILSIDLPATYVVGSAFKRQPVIGRFLTGLGCLFAGGGTTAEATALTDKLAAILLGGDSLVVFPEGGLSPTVGLRRFRLGAFRAAAAVGVPIVPIGISGSRSVVPPGERRVRPGAVRVAIGSPIAPAGTDWRSLVGLRDAVHGAVSTLSGEVSLVDPQ
jgi:1-acyl-sn-glycerol-3-phosphate acyltransferase